MIEVHANTARIIPTLQDLSESEEGVLVRHINEERNEIFLFCGFIDNMHAELVCLRFGRTIYVPREDFLRWRLVADIVSLKNSPHVLNIIGERETCQ